MSSSERELVFYYDVVSAFGYATFHVLRNSAGAALANAGVTVEYRPLFHAGIMAATGNTPPLTITNKGPYTSRDFARQCQRHGVPLAAAVPPGFPQNTLLAQRSLCVVAERFPDAYLPAAEQLFNAVWVEHLILGAPELRTVLGRVLPRDEAARVVAEAAEAWAKERLKAYTDEALATGCFGVPWMVTRRPGECDETWWGLDHLVLAAEWLGVDISREGGFAINPQL